MAILLFAAAEGTAPPAAAGSGVSVHSEFRALPAPLDIRARLAIALGSAGRHAHQRLHADTARTRVASDRCRRKFLYTCAVAAAVGRVFAACGYQAPKRQSPHDPTGTRFAQHTPGRCGLRSGRPQNVYATGLLLHADAAQARR